MNRLDVERLGGFGSYGSPGSHVRSRGQIDTTNLAPADQRAVEALFARPPGGTPVPDAFRYRLTRHTAHGAQSVEVPEQHVPAAVQAVVKDELV